MPDWTEECIQEEFRQKGICSHRLYTIMPKMTGVFSIAEVVDDSNKKSKQTVFCVLESDRVDSFTEGQMKSLIQVGKMVEQNGGVFFTDLDDVAKFLNNES